MNKAGTLLIVTLLTFSSSALAEQPSASAVGTNLPDNVRSLLKQEMVSVLDATKAIIEALVQGQDDIVASNAQAIHDSFILKQAMTEADRKALMSVVSDSFVEKDRAFHAMAAKLSQAAKDGDRERQMILFQKMTNACVACHAAHATDRFPQLKK